MAAVPGDTAVTLPFPTVAMTVDARAIRNRRSRSRDLRAMRDFLGEHKARLGVVINTDIRPRLYDDRIVGIPLNWL